jgi:hypothetical protein
LARQAVASDKRPFGEVADGGRREDYGSSVAQITIEASDVELELFGERYDRLRAELENAGHHVVVREALAGRTLGQALQDVALHVAGNVDAYVEGAVTAAAFKWLRGRATAEKSEARARLARIYGADGKVIREFDLPDG